MALAVAEDGIVNLSVAVIGGVAASMGVTAALVIGVFAPPKVIKDMINPRTRLEVVCPGGVWLSSITKFEPIFADNTWFLRVAEKQFRFAVPPTCRGREGVLIESATPSYAEGVAWHPEREFPQPPVAKGAKK